MNPALYQLSYTAETLTQRGNAPGTCMENDLPSATNMRLLALTAAVASILKHLPAARAELEEIAMALDDSPPVAVSDAMLENFSQEILDVIAGRWK